MPKLPVITVPTITLEGDANGAPHPEPAAYAKKFSGKYAHRIITGGDRAQLCRRKPRRAFAQAVVGVDAGGLITLTILHNLTCLGRRRLAGCRGIRRARPSASFPCCRWGWSQRVGRSARNQRSGRSRHRNSPGIRRLRRTARRGASSPNSRSSKSSNTRLALLPISSNLSEARGGKPGAAMVPVTSTGQPPAVSRKMAAKVSPFASCSERRVRAATTRNGPHRYRMVSRIDKSAPRRSSSDASEP